jgi:hypothetical protein
VILTIHKVFSRIWIPCCFLNAIFIFFYKSGMEFADHGGLNRFTFFAASLIIFFVYGVIMSFVKLYKCNRVLFLAAFSSLLFSFWLFYSRRIVGSCGNWEEGLAGHSIDNTGNQCKVPIPTMCELGIRDNWLDFSKFSPQCVNTKTFLKTSSLPKGLKDRKNVTHIGYPRVEDWDEYIKINQETYRTEVRERLIDMDDPKVPQEIKDKTEFVVDMSNPEHHKLEMTLKPNIKRAEEQRKLRKEIIDKEKEDGTYGSRVDKNMLVIYIDNISRAHFFRKMPKTAEWLSQYVDNEDSDYKTYQYFRYHSSYYNTLYSNAGLYYGQVKHVDDTSKNVFDSYSKNGYVTGFFKDSCETNAVSVHDLEPHTHRWDHFGGEVTCDYNYDNTDFTSLRVFSGKGSAIRH